jgi:hypothetical protein
MPPPRLSGLLLCFPRVAAGRVQTWLEERQPQLEVSAPPTTASLRGGVAAAGCCQRLYQLQLNSQSHRCLPPDQPDHGCQRTITAS